MFWFPLEYPVSFVLFLVVLACIAQAWFFKKDFFNPPTVYCFSQCITLGIAYFKYNKAMSDFQLKTWLFWLGAMISFCVGSYLVRLVAKSHCEPVRIAEASAPEGYNWKMHVALSFILFALFRVGVFGIIQIAGNLLLLTDDPSRWMKKDTNYGYYSVLFSSGPLCVLLFGIAAFSKFNPLKGVRWLARFMVVLTILLNLLAYPTRGTLFFSIGFLIILFNYLRKRVSAAWILVLLALAAAGFIAISSLRDQYQGNSVQGWRSRPCLTCRTSTCRTITGISTMPSTRRRTGSTTRTPTASTSSSACSNSRSCPAVSATAWAGTRFSTNASRRCAA